MTDQELVKKINEIKERCYYRINQNLPGTKKWEKYRKDCLADAALEVFRLIHSSFDAADYNDA